jgi:HD-GYP domain-containing protein (c-di-GMP phosphodiesterase class II)
LTTNRPYQRAYDPLEALRVIQNLSGQRLDPKAVIALVAVYQRGEIHIQKHLTQPTPTEPVPVPIAPLVPADPLTVETTRT